MSEDPTLKHHRTRVRQWDTAETEEDLLRLQEQFLSEKEKGSTTCIRAPKKQPVVQEKVPGPSVQRDQSTLDQGLPTLSSLPIGSIKEKNTEILSSSSGKKTETSIEGKEGEPKKKLSLFAQRRREAAKAGNEGKGKEGSMSNLLGGIVERPTGPAPSFPTLMSIEATPSEEDMDRLVERYIRTGGMNVVADETGMEAEVDRRVPTPPAPSSTYAQMDAENRVRVDEMGPEERSEALRELEGMMDVDRLRSFFASRSKDPQVRAKEVEKALDGKRSRGDPPPSKIPEPSSPKDKKKQVTFELPNVPDIRDNVVIEEEEEEDTPGELRKHFPSSVPTEFDKMAWMDERMEAKARKEASSSASQDSSSSSQPRPVGLQPLSHTAAGWRFDLQGQRLTGKEEIPRHEGLHHHGDDPDKPGYTIQEMLWLARSAVGAQRSMAWRMLTGLMASVRWRRGGLGREEARDIYDLLLHLELAMWIREAVQDRTLGVVVGAVDVLWAWVQDRWEGPEGSKEGEIWGYKAEDKRLLKVCRLIQVPELIQAIRQARPLPMDTMERMDRILTCISWIGKEGEEEVEDANGDKEEEDDGKV
ncbi:MAG: RPAP1-like protein [Piptocephalis tieghemiana]|nr:MAG: RPAP1-like protein [Piptocephalis tieghemiana]